MLQRLLADEIGIEFAVVGDWMLRSTQTPIFGRNGALLKPQGIEAGIAGLRSVANASMSGADISARIGGSRTDMLRIALALRNHRFAGAEGLDLFVKLSPTLLSRPALINRAIQSLAEIDLAASRIVCFVDAGTVWTAPRLRSIAVLREAGIGLGLASVLAAHDFRVEARTLSVSYLRLEPDWLRLLSKSASGTRLLASFVSVCHDEGWRILAPALTHLEDLQLAYDVGFDLLQGDFLARTSLTGSLIDTAPRAVTEAQSTIVPFRRPWRAAKNP